MTLITTLLTRKTTKNKQKWLSLNARFKTISIGFNVETQHLPHFLAIFSSKFRLYTSTQNKISSVHVTVCDVLLIVSLHVLLLQCVNASIRSSNYVLSASTKQIADRTADWVSHHFSQQFFLNWWKYKISFEEGSWKKEQTNFLLRLIENACGSKWYAFLHILHLPFSIPPFVLLCSTFLHLIFASILHCEPVSYKIESRLTWLILQRKCTANCTIVTLFEHSLAIVVAVMALLYEKIIYYNWTMNIHLTFFLLSKCEEAVCEQRQH